VPSLIQSVYLALSGLGSTPYGEVTTNANTVPAVAVHESINNDHLVCLEDGQTFKMLKNHLKTKHGLTPDEYRARWDLPLDYPMVAPAYSERRRQIAKEMELGCKSVPPRRGKLARLTK